MPQCKMLLSGWATDPFTLKVFTFEKSMFIWQFPALWKMVQGLVEAENPHWQYPLTITSPLGRKQQDTFMLCTETAGYIDHMAFQGKLKFRMNISCVSFIHDYRANFSQLHLNGGFPLLQVSGHPLPPALQRIENAM